MIKMIKNFFGGKSPKEEHGLQNPEQWFLDGLGLSPLASGVSVSEDTAMRHATVFACVRILSDTIASLPLILYRKLPDGGKVRAVNHPLYSVLHDLPAPGITSFRMRSVLQGHLATWGNAYAFIKRDGNNRVRNILPIRPDIVRVETGSGGDIFYRINGKVTTKQVLHIPGLGFDGLRGYSVIGMVRESIGLGLAAEEFGARFFGDGTHPGAIVNHPGKLSEEAHKRLKSSLHKAHSGLGKSHKMMLLEEGMTLQNIGIPPEDAQFIETRKFQRSEIYSIYRIPPHMVGDQDGSTSWGTGIEQQSIGFVVYTIRPWLVLWEQELERVLLSDADKKAGYFIEHLVDGLLRGDIKSRYDAYAVGRQHGWLSANDIRSMENMNPIENGDQYLVPLNMAPAGEENSPAAENKNKNFKVISRKISRKESREDEPEDEKKIKGLVRIGKEYREKFTAVFQSIVDKEIKEIQAAVEEIYKLRSDDTLLSWLEKYYKKFPGDIKEKFGPVLKECSAVVEKEASRMVGSGPAFTEKLEKFVDEYLKVYILRHVGSSAGQLKSIIAQSELDNLTDDLLGRLVEWKENRAHKISDDESIRVINAVARETWAQKGVTKLKWVTQGSNSCPFCKQLNNKIVGVKEAFIEKDEVLYAGDDGVDDQGKLQGNVMAIKGKKMHPPIHKGCVCAVVPVMETRYNFKKADPKEFIGQRDQLPGDLKAFVTPYTAKEYIDKKIKLYLAESQLAGYGLTKNNELVSVFSLPGVHQGNIAVEKAIESGARSLYCFDTKLVKFYNQFGFKETGRLAWNKEQTLMHIKQILNGLHQNQVIKQTKGQKRFRLWLINLLKPCLEKMS